MLVSISARASRMDPGISSAIAELRKTPLNALHRRLGARMVNFGGWDMPVEYPATGGLMAEHKAVRNAVGIFDVSHMGDIRIRTGKTQGGALAAVQHLSMNDASKLVVGQAHYSAMLYPEGTFVDDVIVHRLGEDDFLFVINAGTREKDVSWVRENAKGFDCVVEDLSDAYTQLAIQGPRAREVLQKLTDAAISEKVWNDVIEAGREFGILACGLGARNTLRLEAKMALYGHEISESINVWEAGLDRYCKMEKPDFLGRPALARASAAGLKRTLVGLEMVERGIARDEYKVFDVAGEEVGRVTSGSPSPTLCKNIALAYVPPALAAVGTTLLVEIRSQRAKAKVVATPFYKRPRNPVPQAVAT